jgi:hypothetical protein
VVIAKLNAAVLASLKAPDVREIFAAQGTDIIGSTPGNFRVTSKRRSPSGRSS